MSPSKNPTQGPRTRTSLRSPNQRQNNHLNNSITIYKSDRRENLTRQEQDWWWSRKMTLYHVPHPPNLSLSSCLRVVLKRMGDEINRDWNGMRDGLSGPWDSLQWSSPSDQGLLNHTTTLRQCYRSIETVRPSESTHFSCINLRLFPQSDGQENK